MERAIIAHKWNGSPDGDFIPWLRDHLANEGFSVSAPEMPSTTIDAWVSAISSAAGTPDLSTCLIGHDVGCQAIVRYLATLQEGQEFRAVFLVAPWTRLEGNVEEGLKQWVNEPINWDAAKRRARRFVVIYSDNDALVPVENSEMFGKLLNAELVLDSGRHHFSDEDDVTQLPSLEKVISESYHENEN